MQMKTGCIGRELRISLSGAMENPVSELDVESHRDAWRGFFIAQATAEFDSAWHRRRVHTGNPGIRELRTAGLCSQATKSPRPGRSVGFPCFGDGL